MSDPTQSPNDQKPGRGARLLGALLDATLWKIVVGVVISLVIVGLLLKAIGGFGGGSGEPPKPGPSLWSSLESLGVRGFLLCLVMPLLFGLLTPIIAIYVNHTIRLRRVRLIHILQDTFSIRTPASARVTKRSPAGAHLSQEAVDTTQSDAGDRTENGSPPVQKREDDASADGCMPARQRPSSFEFVAAKYLYDLPSNIQTQAKKIERFTEAGRHCEAEDAMIELFEQLTTIGCLRIRDNWMIFWSALPYVAVVCLGFVLVFGCALGGSGAVASDLLAALKTLTSDPGSQSKMADLALALAIAFASAYLYTVRQITQAVLGFDLTGGTFFQAFRHMITCSAGLVVLWLAFDLILGTASAALPGADTIGFKAKLLYLVAFGIGQVPDSGYWMVFTVLGRFGIFSWLTSHFKRKDERFVEVTASIPLDVIDGIDLLTRMRLEDANIAEVQNLATYNPILLHVETRFGLYQAIDWVAQAQLCNVVGLERFLLMRQFNIRTIFDLERAVLSLKATEHTKRLVASILFMPTEAGSRVEAIGKLKLTKLGTSPDVPAPGQAASYADLSRQATEGLAVRATATFRRPSEDCGVPDVFPAAPLLPGVPPSPPGRNPFTYLYTYTDHINRAGAPGTTYHVYELNDEFATLEHLIMIILDDLHVVRLRQVWEWIDRNIGPDARALDDTKASIYGA